MKKNQNLRGLLSSSLDFTELRAFKHFLQQKKKRKRVEIIQEGDDGGGKKKTKDWFSFHPRTLVLAEGPDHLDPRGPGQVLNSGRMWNSGILTSNSQLDLRLITGEGLS